MQTLPIKPSKLRLGKLLLPASLMMILSACHMLIPPKQTPAKLLEKQEAVSLQTVVSVQRHNLF